MTSYYPNNKISNIAQIGGIETSVLDNGAGRGTRIAWVNTGAGLRYKVVIDRAMDIADAFYNQHSLAWLNLPGITPPQPFSDKGIDWLRTFNGGLLTTCGLSHVGGPESDEFGERGLHGLISNTPAQLESVIQPDLADGRHEMSITGTVQQARIFGPSLSLRRTISGTLGRAAIKIHDEVVNRGNEAAPLMLLYHFNFGWPLADEGADLVWKGGWQHRFGDSNNRIFNKGNNFRKCPAPLDVHNGSGEDVAFIDIAADSGGMCICGLCNAAIGIAATLKFNKSQLPWLTNWQHWGKGEYVTGLEPGTNPPVGQAGARAQNELLYLAPGEIRSFDLEFEVLNDQDAINDFLKENSGG